MNDGIREGLDREGGASLGAEFYAPPATLRAEGGPKYGTMDHDEALRLLDEHNRSESTRKATEAAHN